MAKKTEITAAGDTAADNSTLMDACGCFRHVDAFFSRHCRDIVQIWGNARQ